MKKAFSILSALIVFAILITACAPAVAPTPETKIVQQTVVVEVTKEITKEIVQTAVPVKSTVNIGYGAPELTGGQGVIMNGMVNGAKSKGWAVMTTNANFDAAQQANQIDYFISLGVKAITVVPVDSKAICASAKKALDAGIFFFTIDRAPIGCEITMTVQSDNYMAGKQAAEAMVKFLTAKNGSAKGIVLELQGDLGQNVAQLRGGGFNDVMKNYPDIKVISKPTEWKAEKFGQATQDVVSTEAVEGIYMHSDCVGTKVVLSTLEQLGKKFVRTDPKHIFITSVDGCPDALAAIRDGFSDEASSQPMPDFGMVISDYMEKVFSGDKIAEGAVTKEGALWSPANIVKSDTGFMMNLATTAVTAENANDAALWGNQAK